MAIHLTSWRDANSRRARPRAFRPVVDTLEAKRALSSIVPAHDRPATMVAAREASIQKFPDIPYRVAADGPLRLDVYVPRGTPPSGGWPVVMAIHGGGWRQYSKDTYGREASVLAGQGYAVVAPNYTLSRPGRSSWPANVSDLRQAVAWIQERSETYRLDPTRIAAMGESAGAHLAEMLGTDPDSPIRAVIASSGPSDLAALCRDSEEGAGLAVRQFLGGPPRRLRAAYAAASPIDRVTERSAPMLLIHGNADRLVPPKQSVAMARALRSHGVDAKVVIVRAGHDVGFAPDGTRLIPKIVAFLDRALAARADAP